jgi:hypothetical protein
MYTKLESKKAEEIDFFRGLALDGYKIKQIYRSKMWRYGISIPDRGEDSLTCSLNSKIHLFVSYSGPNFVTNNDI